MKTPSGTTRKASLDMRVLTPLFFLSGASSLIVETVFSRMLSYTFGNTAQAVSTVLAAFLGGLALGAFCFGLWIYRRKASLWIYGALEALVGVYALLIPKIFTLLTAAYVHLCQQYAFGPAGLTIVRFGLASVAILPASFFLGGTLPVVSRYVAGRFSEFEKKVDGLYAWNTLGAATGALLSTYCLVPLLGILGALYVACTTNLIIFISATLLPRLQGNAGRQQADHLLEELNPEVAPRSSLQLLLLLGAFFTGAAGLAYEVIWTHIQAFTIGNTVYAFGVTLFVVLCGLGLGAQIVARNFSNRETWGKALITSQFLLGASVFFSLPLWGGLNDVFRRGYVGMLQVDAFGLALLTFAGIAYAWRKTNRPLTSGTPVQNYRHILLLAMGGILAISVVTLFRHSDEIVFNTVTGLHDTTLFVASELMRLLCAFFLLIVPAFLLGIAFPLLINLFCGSAGAAGSRVGRIYAANILGTVLGSVVTGFFLIPLLGSQGTLRSIATCNVIVAFFFIWLLWPASLQRRAVWAAAALGVVAVGWLGVPNWDPRLISTGSYVYFVPGFRADRVLYEKEDVAGGMTSVVQDGPIRTMLSNGKFQGNNSAEKGAQVRFALVPMLFVRDPDNGLVIGLGTGQTLNTLSLFPFRRIDVAELAPQIVEAARTWFTDVNGGVLDQDSRVHVSIADGRNFLLLTRRKYNLITIEVSSIWIDGEADLYNQEFYKLCREHMSDGGVLQQWVQLHHMPTKNLLVILNTVAHTFSHVAFFVGDGQGLMLASNQPFETDYNRLRAWDSDPGVRRALDSIQVPATESLLGDMVLYGDSLDKAVSLLPEIAHLPGDFVSSDLHPYLEYETPKGNVYPVNTNLANGELFARLRPSRVPIELVANMNSPNERNLLQGFVLAEQHKTRDAVEFLASVTGSDKPLAQQEIARLASAPTASVQKP